MHVRVCEYNNNNKINVASFYFQMRLLFVVVGKVRVLDWRGVGKGRGRGASQVRQLYSLYEMIIKDGELGEEKGGGRKFVCR